MDEYIPQLTLTPDLNAQPQPEVKKEEDLITKAQAAPEAGPDLSALSAQEQQAVLAFSKQIDLENAQQILEYGASAQKNIADFSDTALAKVKTGDLGEIGTMLSHFWLLVACRRNRLLPDRRSRFAHRLISL